MSHAPGLTPVVALLSAIVEERAGLHYGPADADVLRGKTELRAAEAGFDSLLDYYYFLRYDPAGPAELDALVDALVVNETYFFRELPPLRHVVDGIVRPAVAEGARPRIWSAACATGEEPLSLAMLLDERGLLGRVELVASDISRRALDRARRGRFGPRAIRDGAVAPLVERHLVRERDGGYAVSRHLVEAIDWRRINLHDRAQVASGGTFDVVLCRNVLIYFSDETAARVANTLASALRPGGVLFVGVSESLLRLGTSFACEEHGEVFLYRRP